MDNLKTHGIVAVSVQQKSSGEKKQPQRRHIQLHNWYSMEVSLAWFIETIVLPPHFFKENLVTLEKYSFKY